MGVNPAKIDKKNREKQDLLFTIQRFFQQI
jgi:hypothetical protein